MLVKIWTDMFTVGVPLLEKIVRPLIVYFFLVIALRLAGKRELAQLNPFDLVVLLMLSNAIQNAIIGEDNSVLGGLVGATALLVVNHVMVRVLYGHRKLDKIIEGDEDVLIERGKLRTQRLKAELITVSELEARAHQEGFRSLKDVERAVIEPGGQIAFFGKLPLPEESRHAEILARLDEIARALSAQKA